MRKVFGYILVGLGAFLLIVAALGFFWAPGQVEKVPNDTDHTTRLSGQARKLNLTSGKLEDLPVKVTQVNKADPKRSTGDVTSWVRTTCVVVDKGDVPDCVTANDPQDRLISATVDAFATDRHTALAVSNPGKYVPPPAVLYKGILNKFGFGTEKKTYPFWDDVLKRPLPAEFQDVEKVHGLEVYKYHVLADKVSTDIAEGVKGFYTVEVTILVEPVTGAIINQTQRDFRQLPDGSTVLDLNVSFTPQQVASDASDGKHDSGQIELITRTVPLVGLIAGLLALAGGIVLLLRARRAAPTADETGAAGPEGPEGPTRRDDHDDVVPGLE